MQNSEFAYFSPKRGKHMKQMCNPPLRGGCWREKVVSDFGFGRSKSHFQAPENEHFWHLGHFVCMGVL